MKKLKRAIEGKNRRWKKMLKVTASSVVTGVLFGTYLLASSSVQAASAISESTPIDWNIVPEERLADALKKQGVISKMLLTMRNIYINIISYSRYIN